VRTPLLKWIVARVEPDRREAFAEAQQQWRALSGAAGFVAQVGGWSRDDPDQACVLALWEDRESHRRFMDGLHDEITARGRQEQTYAALAVALFEQDLPHRLRRR
jgi:heme-degrading monooxygenase HmoA